MKVKKLIMSDGEQEPNCLYFESLQYEDEFLEDFEENWGYCNEKDEIENNFKFDEKELIDNSKDYFMCQEMDINTFLIYFEPYQ